LKANVQAISTENNSNAFDTCCQKHTRQGVRQHSWNQHLLHPHASISWRAQLLRHCEML